MNAVKSEYWEKFYKKFNVKQPSDFAKFCIPYLKNLYMIFDIGCGNGRDTYYFAKHGHVTIGIDKANKPKDSRNACFFKSDFSIFDFKCDAVYARFFLHSIENLDIVKFLSKVDGLILLEFRNKGDKPIVYKHDRNLIDGEAVKKILEEMDFKILYFKIGRGMARYQKENPLICRIIAEKI